MKRLATLVSIVALCAVVGVMTGSANATVLFETDFSTPDPGVKADFLGTGAGQFETTTASLPNISFDDANDVLTATRPVGGRPNAFLASDATVSQMLARYSLDLSFSSTGPLAGAYAPFFLKFGKMVPGDPANNSNLFQHIGVDYTATHASLSGGPLMAQDTVQHIEVLCNGNWTGAAWAPVKGADITYLDPVGGTSTLAAWTTDIWIGTTKTTYAATKGGANVGGFKIHDGGYMYVTAQIDVHSVKIYDGAEMDIPEPVTVGLLAIGGLGMLLRRRRA